ncbi:MAG: response regulator [Sulfitobacter sp.]
MDPINPFTTTIATPTAARPLLGLTVLVVEDSRFACEAMRLLCLSSGARIRRADCLRSARRHLQVYRPTVVIADLGLPDGSGLDLIAELADSQPAVEVILATSGDSSLAGAARAAGAHGFMPKPVTAIAEFQETILALLPAERRPNGPRVMTNETIAPDQIAYRDDMAHIADMLEIPPDERALDYVAQFLSGVAHAADDTLMEQAARSLALRRAQGQPTGSQTAAIAGMIQQRLAHKIAI